VKPERKPPPPPAAEPVEREPATPEPVEQLSPEQVAEKCRAAMTRVLAALDELRPHAYDQKVSEDVKWLRRRAQQIQRSA
jgi:hypothetical protein